MKLKKCNTCDTYKSYDGFHNCQKNKSGIDNTCSSCKNVDPKVIYGKIRAKAASKNLEFDLTLSDITKFLVGKCYYCGQEVKEGESRNGIDRVDNTKGYSWSNCVSCCWSCNNMKSNKGFNEFIIHVQKIAKNLEGKEE